jgi:hypothetical protein
VVLGAHDRHEAKLLGDADDIDGDVRAVGPVAKILVEDFFLAVRFEPHPQRHVWHIQGVGKKYTISGHAVFGRLRSFVVAKEKNQPTNNAQAAPKQ